jgi:chemotaxis protein CheC
MLSPEQSDAWTEVINIGFSRAATSLSELTGYRVLLDPPHVAIYPIAELGDALKTIISGDIATVHQIFSGPVAGNAMLILSHDDATLPARLLTDDQWKSRTLDVSDREVLMETGNILLSEK